MRRHAVRPFPRFATAATPAAAGLRARGRKLHGHEKGRMNSTERRFFLSVIEPAMAGVHGELGALVARSDFERFTLRLTEPERGDGVALTWTPDFMLTLANGLTVFIDVKGSQPNEQTQDVKAKVAAEQFPMWFFAQAKVVPKKAGGGWSWRWFGGVPANYVDLSDGDLVVEGAAVTVVAPRAAADAHGQGDLHWSRREARRAGSW